MNRSSSIVKRRLWHVPKRKLLQTIEQRHKLLSKAKQSFKPSRPLSSPKHIANLPRWLLIRFGLCSDPESNSESTSRRREVKRKQDSATSEMESNWTPSHPMGVAYSTLPLSHCGSVVLRSQPPDDGNCSSSMNHSATYTETTTGSVVPNW